ncbi:MAG: hypothetical protein WDL87_01895 [Candidatus Omnitrophota bacterium]|jgi:transcriptional regulator with XRE-family HTH domain
METFGKYLDILLKSKKITKATLARGLKLKRQNYITNVISGLHTPTLERVEQISKIINCNQQEKAKLINLDIEDRKKKNSKKYATQPTYPEIRNLLLNRYSNKIVPRTIGGKYANLDEIKTVIVAYPFHIIEKIILQEIYNRLVEFNDVPSVPLNYSPLEYFNMLTAEGKKQRIEKAGVRWAYDKTHEIIAFKFDNNKLYLKFVYQEESPRLARLRESLLDLYKTFDQKGDSKEKIEKVVMLDPRHRIEEKILSELNKRLPPKSKVNTFEQFVFRPKEDLIKMFNEANLTGWGCRVEADLLFLKFNKDDPLTFKLAWQEIDKKK